MRAMYQQKIKGSKRQKIHAHVPTPTSIDNDPGRARATAQRTTRRHLASWVTGHVSIPLHRISRNSHGRSCLSTGRKTVISGKRYNNTTYSYRQGRCVHLRVKQCNTYTYIQTSQFRVISGDGTASLITHLTSWPHRKGHRVHHHRRVPRRAATRASCPPGVEAAHSRCDVLYKIPELPVQSHYFQKINSSTTLSRARKKIFAD